MRLLLRLLSGIWLAVLLVTGSFAYLEVQEERERLVQDLGRRAALAADAVRETAEPLVARQARTGDDRVLRRFGPPDRGIAIYDEFGSVIGAPREVKPFLGPVPPLVSETIRTGVPARQFHEMGGHTRWVHIARLERDDRAVGAAAVFLDAQFLDSQEWQLWRRTAVRLGVLILILTGITWILVRTTVTRPIARIAERIMLACGGVWVAHGSGDADRVVGERIGLPSLDPTYTLRRVWLEPAEETGYYYGFANEGLWPLCHIVHERPQFRAGDWEQYRAVNQKFANALLEEMEKADAPIVLVQDYHFALLPRMIKQARPDARVALFWHIPWPNFEAFGICPWQEEILLGMLGADLIGFHTQFHCNNFLETVERTIEGRVEWDDFAVVRGHHTTHVLPFPISVAAEPEERAPAVDDPPAMLETPVEFLGIGVERIDYTKGLPERFRALRRFFERWPEYRRRVGFVQLASPSRSRIPRYQQLQEEIHEIVRRINDEIGEWGWQPIVYHERHHEHREIRAWYRAAQFCVVSSLHDGMNLVAKEFIAARDDDDAVLILSRFTGASRELRDALLVNPYDIEGTAEAIHRAIEMAPAERRDRMSHMRAHVREQNIFRWAGMLMSELTRIPRGDRPGVTAAPGPS